MKKLLNKKGMTLVEVIVVLVILAILAAILVPSMVKWIDDANKKTILAEGRTVLLAAQSIAIEDYGIDGVITPGDYTGTGTKIDDIAALAEVDKTKITVTVDTAGKVTAVTYTKGNKIATFDGTSWEVGPTS